MSEAFLEEFHDAHPAATPRALGWGRLPGGLSSYEYLAAVLPERVGLRVLDLGCGDGHLRGVLRAGVDYVGVDLGTADLERARRLYPGIDVRRERAQALSLPDDSVDAVLCHMALMLMDDLDAVLSEATRVLAPGGVFAAIIGGPLAGDDAFTVFAELCREAGERGQLDRVSLGDPRLGSIDRIECTFADHGYTASVDDAWLILDADIDVVWASLALTYDVAWMSDEARRDVERALRERVRFLETAAGLIPFRLCARRITARPR